MLLPAMERWLLRQDEDPRAGLATLARLAQTCRACAEGLRPLLAKARRAQKQQQQAAAAAVPIWRRAVAAIE